MDFLTMERWSPYLAGIGIGLIAIVAFLLSGRGIGASSAYAQTSGMIEMLFRGSKVKNKEYYKKTKPEIGWEWLFVVGLFIGAFISAQVSGAARIIFVPETWRDAFGQTVLPRLIVALLGGVVMGFGARWAGGCTSGHGISGTLQLAVSSWIAVICFFIGGVISAMFIYHIIG